MMYTKEDLERMKRSLGIEEIDYKLPEELKKEMNTVHMYKYKNFDGEFAYAAERNNLITHNELMGLAHECVENYCEGRYISDKAFLKDSSIPFDKNDRCRIYMYFSRLLKSKGDADNKTYNLSADNEYEEIIITSTETSEK